MKARIFNYTLQMLHAGSAIYGYFWSVPGWQNVAKLITAASVGLAFLNAFLLLVVGIMDGEAKDKALKGMADIKDTLWIAHHASSLAAMAAFAWFGHLVWASVVVFEWGFVCFMRAARKEMVKSHEEKGAKS